MPFFVPWLIKISLDMYFRLLFNIQCYHKLCTLNLFGLRKKREIWLTFLFLINTRLKKKCHCEWSLLYRVHIFCPLKLNEQERKWDIKLIWFLYLTINIPCTLKFSSHILIRESKCKNIYIFLFILFTYKKKGEEYVFHFYSISLPS